MEQCAGRYAISIQVGDFAFRQSPIEDQDFIQAAGEVTRVS